MVHRLETCIVTARAQKCFGAVFLYGNFKIKNKMKNGCGAIFGTGGDEKHVFCLYSPRAQGVLFTFSRPKGLKVVSSVEISADFENPFLKKNLRRAFFRN